MDIKQLIDNLSDAREKILCSDYQGAEDDLEYIIDELDKATNDSKPVANLIKYCEEQKQSAINILNSDDAKHDFQKEIIDQTKKTLTDLLDNILKGLRDL